MTGPLPGLRLAAVLPDQRCDRPGIHGGGYVCGVCDEPIHIEADVVALARGWGSEVRSTWWEHDVVPTDAHDATGPEDPTWP